VLGGEAQVGGEVFKVILEALDGRGVERAPVGCLNLVGCGNLILVVRGLSVARR
jgi:hypothetical protein